MLVSLRGQRVDCYLILLGGERRERGGREEMRVKFFFPIKNNDSIIRPKL